VFKHDEKTRTLMRQLLETLAFMHEHDIVHRDVKTSNILWDDASQHLTLIDFDVAAFHRHGERPMHSLVGTHGYIAPEVRVAAAARRRRDETKKQSYDERVDTFSSGVVFAQMLFGIREGEVGETRKEANSAAKIRQRLRKLLAINFYSQRADLTLALEMLHPTPESRPTPKEALQSAYFNG